MRVASQLDFRVVAATCPEKEWQATTPRENAGTLCHTYMCVYQDSSAWCGVELFCLGQAR